MIKSPEFYEIFKEYEQPFLDAGFKPTTRNSNRYISSNDVGIRIILDKWGWSDEDGWGFIVRVRDMQMVNAVGERPDNILDIMPNVLVEKGLISEQDIESLYGRYKVVLPKMYEYATTSYLYSFYDPDQLRQILKFFTPALAKVAVQWAESRKEARKKPVQKPSRHSEAAKKQFQANLDKIVKEIKKDSGENDVHIKIM
jgi:hypothetical protein